MVLAKNGTEVLDQMRSSSTAFIEREDPIAQCIHKRVSQFQGYHPEKDIESLQVTAYKQTQGYRNHFDWFGPSENMTTDRITTIFSILEADCDNCGTKFPLIRNLNLGAQDERWCSIVNCSLQALTVLPIPGSGLFWRNLHSDGRGDLRMQHAGMPLTRGYKTGLNIFSLTEIGQEVNRTAAY